MASITFTAAKNSAGLNQGAEIGVGVSFSLGNAVLLSLAATWFLLGRRWNPQASQSTDSSLETRDSTVSSVGIRLFEEALGSGVRLKEWAFASDNISGHPFQIPYIIRVVH